MQDTLTIIWFYLANVFIIALPFAVLEIWLEKFKSEWDGEFNSAFWGKKIQIKLLLKMTDKTYITVYHFVMFGLFLPGILTLESFVLFHAGQNQFWIFEVNGARLIALIFIFAVWLGVAVVEDFLWFLLNWRYPKALGKLFKAELAWHTHWISLTNSIKLPRFYITAPIVVVILFVINYIFVSVV